VRIVLDTTILVRANENPQGVARQLLLDIVTGAGGVYLWVLNPAREKKTVAVHLAADFHSAEDVWAGQSVAVANRQITVTIPPRDGAVVALR
jgi:hypothetical protein